MRAAPLDQMCRGRREPSRPRELSARETTGREIDHGDRYMLQAKKSRSRKDSLTNSSWATCAFEHLPCWSPRVLEISATMDAAKGALASCVILTPVFADASSMVGQSPSRGVAQT